MVPTIEENHISETIKIQDNYGLDYSLKVLHTYNDDQTLFSIIINLVRHKRNKNVGQANLLFESNNDALIGNLIIYDYSSYLSINDKLYSLFNWNEPNNYQRRGLGTKILKYLIETAKINDPAASSGVLYSGPIWFVNRESEINGIMKSQKREEK